MVPTVFDCTCQDCLCFPGSSLLTCKWQGLQFSEIADLNDPHVTHRLCQPWCPLHWRFCHGRWGLHVASLSPISNLRVIVKNTMIVPHINGFPYPIISLYQMSIYTYSSIYIYTHVNIFIYMFKVSIYIYTCKYIYLYVSSFNIYIYIYIQM